MIRVTAVVISNEWSMKKTRERTPAGYIYPYLAQTTGPRDEDPPFRDLGTDNYRGADDGS